MTRLLFEIGTEAIPAGYMAPALAALLEKARVGLDALRLEPGEIRALGTPRRLVLLVDGIADRQQDRTLEVQGPRADIAFRDGKPTKAAEGFAKKNRISVDDLEQIETERGAFVLARVHEAGRDAGEVLPEFLESLVSALPWPKVMRWQGDGFLFPRPIRWVTALLGDQVLPLEIAGLAAGRQTSGHSLLAPGEHHVESAGEFEAVMEKARIILDPAVRRERIGAALRKTAEGLGGRLVNDEELLDEVVFLAEHPVVHAGSFDSDFLAIPREVTVTAMRSHQRYFAVEDDQGRLMAHFLVVCDGEWADPALVIAGNERVLRARLADARFYWDFDLKTGLDAHAESLNKVVWLEAVGTMAEKSARVAALVDWLGRGWHGESWPELRDASLRAARLSKADLASEMIKDGKEFTGLQGVIGARYAEASGEDPAVASALAEQYLPRGSRDALPGSEPGLILALADRMDTLAGCWAAGFIPTGSQDPYALRRAANGAIRMLLEKERHLSLSALVHEAITALPEAVRGDALAGELLEFLRDRTAFYFRERGIGYDVVDAVLTADSDDPLDARVRAEALQAVRGEPALEQLVIGFKRAANILKGVDEPALPSLDTQDWNGAAEAERTLHRAAESARPAIASAREARDYPAMLGHLLELRAPIDRFFDDVLVMDEDDNVRDRRLALLAEVRGLFDHLCDLSKIVLEGDEK